MISDGLLKTIEYWIPAFAGMTMRGDCFAALATTDVGYEVFSNFNSANEFAPTTFVRVVIDYGRQEGIPDGARNWIPAFAGMTGTTRWGTGT